MSSPSGDGYQVKFSAMTSAAELLGTVSNNVVQRVADLEATSGSKLATWSSEARDVFKIVEQDWDEACTEIGNIVKRAGTALGNINFNYQNVERLNADKWNSFSM